MRTTNKFLLFLLVINSNNFINASQSSNFSYGKVILSGLASAFCFYQAGQKLTELEKMSESFTTKQKRNKEMCDVFEPINANIQTNSTHNINPKLLDQQINTFETNHPKLVQIKQTPLYRDFFSRKLHREAMGHPLTAIDYYNKFKEQWNLFKGDKALTGELGPLQARKSDANEALDISISIAKIDELTLPHLRTASQKFLEHKQKQSQRRAEKLQKGQDFVNGARLFGFIAAGMTLFYALRK